MLPAKQREALIGWKIGGLIVSANLAGELHNNMRVSIIIPTLNPGPSFPTLIQNLRGQTLGDTQILVVDSSSDDGTAVTAKSLGVDVLIVPRGQFDHGQTRNEAGHTAEGDTLVYLTQDVIPVSRGSIEMLVKPFLESENIGATYGKQVPGKGSSPLASHLRSFNYPDSRMVKGMENSKQLGLKAPFLSNSFAAYRRTVLERIGWFKDKMLFGEDQYAGARILMAGYKIAYEPAAQVYHSHDYSVLQEFKRYFDIGVFHEMESWLLMTFGQPEGEGLKYVFSEVKYLRMRRMAYLIPESFIRNFAKFIGYRLGRHYRVLPQCLINEFTMSPLWWQKELNDA
jgi:rhamnosyltransferase